MLLKNQCFHLSLALCFGIGSLSIAPYTLLDNSFTDLAGDHNWVNPRNWSLAHLPNLSEKAIIGSDKEVIIPAYYQAIAGDIETQGELTVDKYATLFLGRARPEFPLGLPEAYDPNTSSIYGIGTNTYEIDLEVWEISNLRQSPVETTDRIQAAIDWAITEAGYDNVLLPAGHYLIGKYGNDIYQAGITLHSNMGFYLDKNAIVEMAPNDKWNYCAIAIRNKENVVISGGMIIGDRQRHIYTPRSGNNSVVHDEGHLICIEGSSKNVTIRKKSLGRANGDGILIVGNGGTDSPVEEVVIEESNFFENRRQGISIVGGKNILINSNEIHHTRGTSPQFGIDLEGAGRTNQAITINGNYFHHNRGGDIVNTDGSGVIIEDNTLEQGENNRYIDGPIVYWKNSDQTIQRNQITMFSTSVNNWNGIIAYANSSPKTNPKTTFILENTCNMCGFYMYNSHDLVIRRNTAIHLAFKNFSNLLIENNDITSYWYCWPYRFLNVTGSASGNTRNGQVYEVPLSETVPYDHCWL